MELTFSGMNFLDLNLLPSLSRQREITISLILKLVLLLYIIICLCTLPPQLSLNVNPFMIDGSLRRCPITRVHLTQNVQFHFISIQVFILTFLTLQRGGGLCHSCTTINNIYRWGNNNRKRVIISYCPVWCESLLELR